MPPEPEVPLRLPDKDDCTDYTGFWRGSVPVRDSDEKASTKLVRDICRDNGLSDETFDKWLASVKADALTTAAKGIPSVYTRLSGGPSQWLLRFASGVRSGRFRG